MSGYIDQIQSGGGGLDWENSKNISVNPPGPFSIWSIMEDQPYTKETVLTVNCAEFRGSNYLNIYGAELTFRIADENAEFSGDWKNYETLNLIPDQIKKKIQFKGESDAGLLIITIGNPRTIYDVLRIKTQAG